jgi:hypothetical protein
LVVERLSTKPVSIKSDANDNLAVNTMLGDPFVDQLQVFERK